MSPVPLIPPPSAVLYVYLAAPDRSLEDLSGALKEYAWRGLAEGRRVRGLSAEVSSVLAQLPDSTPLRPIISAPPLSILYPLVHLPYHPHYPSNQLRSPPPLLLASTFDGISRKQVIDTLVRLSRDKALLNGEVQGSREQVLEVCLEYVARRWRGRHGEGADAADIISLKLTEIEFETQMQGNALSVRAVVLPLIQQIRFHLGLVSSSQLATRVNGDSSLGRYLPRSHFDTAPLLRSWIAIRLRCGMTPQGLVSDLISVREKILLTKDRDLFLQTLSEFGLLGRGIAGTDPIATNDFSPLRLHDSNLPNDSKVFGKGRGGLISSRSSKKVLPSTGKWWTHRRNISFSSRVDRLPVTDTDRRPSLPVISSPSLLTFGVTAGAPLRKYYTSTSSIESNTAKASTAPTYASTPDLLSSMMTFQSPEDMRVIFLDHLLSLKHDIGSSAEEDWHLGHGRQLAIESVNTLQAKLVGKKDVMGVQAVFDDLRSLFRLPGFAPAPSGSKSKSRSASLVERFPAVPLRYSLIAPEEPQSPSGYTFSERGTSFDLDQYMHDDTSSHGLADAYAGTKGDAYDPVRRKSSGTTSALTALTNMTDLPSPEHSRTSVLSAFTIRRATVRRPTLMDDVQNSARRRPTSLTDTSESALYSLDVLGHTDESWCHIDRPDSRLRCLSQPNLHEVLNSPSLPTSVDGHSVFAHLLATHDLHSPLTGMFQLEEDANTPGFHLRPAISDTGHSTPVPSPPSPCCPRTPTDIKKNPNRHCAVVDGEHFSPPGSERAVSVANDLHSIELEQSDRTWESLAHPGTEDQDLLRDIIRLFSLRADSLVLRHGVFEAQVGAIFSRIRKQSAGSANNGYPTWVERQLSTLVHGTPPAPVANTESPHHHAKGRPPPWRGTSCPLSTSLSTCSSELGVFTGHMRSQITQVRTERVMSAYSTASGESVNTFGYHG